MEIIDDKRYLEAFDRFGKSDTQNVFTPPRIIRRMLNNIKFNENSKILIWYNVEFLIYLVKEIGLSPKNIYIYTNTKDKLILKKQGYNVIFQEEINFDNINNELNEVKFDIVIGNPPYQSENNKGNKLWIKFINKSFELSKNLCYVVPISLLTSNSKQVVVIRTKMSDKKNVFNLTQQDIFGLGEKILYFSSIECNQKESVIILQNGEEKKIDNLIDRQPINVNDDIKLSIFQKVENYINKNDYVYDFNLNSNQTTPNRLINQGLISNVQDDTIFKYKVHHSASKIFYSKVLVSEYSKNNETTYGKLKVVLNYSGGFVGEKYMFMSRDMIGKQMLGILVENEIEGNNLIQTYSSKLFRWYISNEKRGGFNTGIYKLPKMDNSKSWNDSELYQYFGLTKEEIEYVEKNVI
jgi:hypothetical protein